MAIEERRPRRRLCDIARDIMSDPTLDATSRRTAGPYLGALLACTSPDQMFYNDRAGIVAIYARDNLKTWRGASARALKAELEEQAR